MYSLPTLPWYLQEAKEQSTQDHEALIEAEDRIRELEEHVSDAREQLAVATDGMSLIAALRENRERLTEFEHMIPDKLAASLEGPEFTKHCEEWFSDLDADKNGVLSAEELFPVIEHFLQDEEIEVTPAHVAEFTEVFDENGDGVIQRDEFESYCRFQVIALYLHHHPDHDGLMVPRTPTSALAVAHDRVSELEAQMEGHISKSEGHAQVGPFVRVWWLCTPWTTIEKYELFPVAFVVIHLVFLVA